MIALGIILFVLCLIFLLAVILQNEKAKSIQQPKKDNE